MATTTSRDTAAVPTHADAGTPSSCQPSLAVTAAGCLRLEPSHFTNHRVDLDSLDYDPGTRKQIWEYHVNQHDEIRRAYITKGPHQPPLKKNKKSGMHNRSFQASWFEYNKSWLEYSPTTDMAYCLPCFVFHSPNGVVGQNKFTVGGFRNWKKVGGKDCYLQGHIGKDPNSAHRVAEQMCKDLMNQSQHLQRVVNHFTTEQIANNRLQLKASIFIVRYLAFQAIAFRG
ncbi:uncharacterized protein LOC142639396 [Castanea sativa]|uniref:uncharacterized protein LOC142639396 n=1 Tax=Castanea sativa TaxID=21020 RepID=UPI003F654682